MADGADILGSWMAHYLAERMEQVAATPDGEARETTRRECIDLILRLWERRYRSPLSQRIEELTTALKSLSDPPTIPQRASEDPEDTWESLRRSLDELHEQEVRLCLEGWIAGLDLSQERKDLRDYSDHLPEKERNLYRDLIRFQDTLTAVDSVPGSDGGQDLTALTANERIEWAKAKLRALSDTQAKITGRYGGAR